jgi:hypothetical protein
MGRARIFRIALGVGGICVWLLGCEGHKSPGAPSPVCGVTLTPASQGFTEDGGTSTVAVATAADCSWRTTSAVDWLVVTSASSGIGPGSVVYAVRPNAGAEARTTTLAVEDQRHTVTQSGRPVPVCTFELDPRSTTVGKDAVDGAFTVSASSGCAWTAVSSAPWLTVTGSASAAGPGRVSYTIARNPNFAARDAGIVVADKTFAVHQAGDTGVPGALNGTWNGRMTDYPGGRTFQMTLAMIGDRVTGRITGDGTGGGGLISGSYMGSGPVHLEADFGDGKQYFDGEFDGPNKVQGTTTYNLRPPRYRFEMTR